MIKTRLAATLSLAFLAVSSAYSAQYKVVELPAAEKGRSSFPSAINNDGEVIVNVTTPYNAPIDIDLLDFERYNDALTDLDAALVGDFNISDYTLVLSDILNQNDYFNSTNSSGERIFLSGSQFFQQIAKATSYYATPEQTDFIPGFGQKSVENEFMWDTTTLVRAVNELGHAVGRSQGEFNKVPYTFGDGTETEVEATFVLNEFSSRGFITLNGNVVELPPTDTTLGGVSDALGINNNNQVVGFGTTSFESEDLQTSYDNCIDEEEVDGVLKRGDLPVESCTSTLINSYALNVSNVSQTRGLIWQLDNSGNVIETKELGLLFTPEADDEGIYSSSAVAINDNGIAVGKSSDIISIRDSVINVSSAVIFSGDEVINITPLIDDNDLVTTTLSIATDINNDNLAIGYKPTLVNGFVRTKFFVYDVNSSELIFPDDFFIGSSSVALDINNNGQVVGYGEIESTQTVRRTGGFIYNHNSSEFTELNTLISCNSPYTIVQANAINDNGDIAATALIEVPLRNARGDAVLDDNGNQILIDTVVAVKLEPIVGGISDDCTRTKTDVNRERQGASIFWLIPFAVFVLGLRRRGFN